MKTPDEFWNEFIEKTGRDNEDKCSGDLTFESQGFQNDSKVALILSGKKTAFFSDERRFLYDYEIFLAKFPPMRTPSCTMKNA